jgi:hypothetical protein
VIAIFTSPPGSMFATLCVKMFGRSCVSRLAVWPAAIAGKGKT